MSEKICNNEKDREPTYYQHIKSYTHLHCIKEREEPIVVIIE